MGRESENIISSTFGDVVRSDQDHLLKNKVSVRDSAIFTMKHWYQVMGRKSNGIICSTFAGLEKSDQGHLLKNRVLVRDSAIVTIEH